MEIAKLLEIYDSRVNDLMVENYDYEIKFELLEKYTKDLENENDDLHEKIHMYEKINNLTDKSITKILSKIGKQLPEEYRAKSRDSFAEILEKRKQERIARRNEKNK